MTEKTIRILYIDESRKDRELIQDIFEKARRHFQVTFTASLKELEDLLSHAEYDVVLSDLNVLGFSKLQILDVIHKIKPMMPVIIITGIGTVENIAELIKRGAADYVIKSSHHIHHIPTTIETALARKRIEEERIQVVEKLKQSEARYRTLVEASRDMIFMIDRNGIIQYVNNLAAQQFNTSPKTIIGNHLEMFFPHEVAVRQKNNIDTTFKTGEPVYIENKTQFPNREEWFGTWLVPIKNQDGIVSTVIGTARNITVWKRAEEALRESETKFRAVADTSLAAIFIYQGEKFTYVNPATENITGYTLNESLEMQFWDIVHPEFRDMVKERGLARQRGEQVPTRYEIKIITKNGEERWLDLGASTTQYERKPAALGIAFDITERKRWEFALKQSETKYRNFLESIFEGFANADMQGYIVEANNGYLNMLGYTQEEIHHLRYQDFTPVKWHRF